MSDAQLPTLFYKAFFKVQPTVELLKCTLLQQQQSSVYYVGALETPYETRDTSLIFDGLDRLTPILLT